MSRIKDKRIDIREIVYSEDDEKSFGDVFIYEPENIEEQNLGNLFIVGELKDQPRNSSYIMNVLASKIKKEFYSNTKRSAEESLEAGLAEANKTLADLAEQGNGEYVGKLSMVCGTYRNSRFYLSQIGRIKSLLIRKGQLLEIVKDEGGKPISTKRAFNNIASGELADGDLVIFSSEGLFDVVPLDALRQLGASMKLEDLAVKLQEEVEEKDAAVVSALLIEIEGEKKELIEHSDVVFAEKEDSTAESLAKALEEESSIDASTIEAEISGSGETSEDAASEQTIVPSSSFPEAENVELAIANKTTRTSDDIGQGLPKKSDIAMEAKEDAALKQIEKNDVEKTRAVPAGEGMETSPKSANEAVPAVKSTGKISLSDIIREYEKMESKSLEAVAEKDKHIEELVTRKEANNFEDLDEREEKLHEKILLKARKSISSLRSGESVAAAAGAIKGIFASKREKEYNVQDGGRKFALLRSKKALGVLAIIVILGGAYSYAAKKEKEDAAAKAATYRALLDESKSKMDQAEVELISGSEDNAGKSYLEALTLARRVESEYDGLDEEASSLIADAQSELDKIDKVVRVDSPAVVVSFDNANLTSLEEVGGDMYLIDGQENAVFKIDVQGAKMTEVAKATEPIGNITLAGSFQNQEILLSDGAAFSDFSIKNNQVQKMSSEMDSSIKDFATYGRYVYVLSPAENQIYKYQKAGASLDGKSEWIKGGDIKDAVSLAIDQYVYILTSGGQVKKYYTGEEFKDADRGAYQVKQPSDPLSSATKIFTLTDQKYLYITEPAKNRIVLFDKASGDLVRQFVGEGLVGMKDLYVDAEEKGLFVLVSGRVIKIDL